MVCLGLLAVIEWYLIWFYPLIMAIIAIILGILFVLVFWIIPLIIWIKERK